MLKIIKSLFVASLLLAGSLVASQLVAQPAYADPPAPDVVNTQANLCQGAGSLSLDTVNKEAADADKATNTCTKQTGTSSTGLDSLITNIVNIFSVVVGIVAVIMIIYGGFRYITSGGDSGNVGNAKNTILYAIIGLVIVALAQFIVKFVLNKSTNAT